MNKTFEAFGQRWRYVWHEDDARPHDAETLAEAWERRYGKMLALTQADAALDWGDAFLYRFGTRLAIDSYPGNSAIAELDDPATSPEEGT